MSLLKFGIVLLVFNFSFCNGCGTGWQSLGGKCYFSSPRIKLNWFEAMHFCDTLGGKLAVPKTWEEDHYVARIAKQHRAFVAWIGVADLVTEGRWLEYPSLEDVPYTHWGPGEPSNDRGTAHCGNLFSKHDYKWNDADCFRRFGFVCEKY